MTTNLFDYFEEAADGTPARWAARAPRRPHENFDIKLTPRLPDWRHDRESLAVLEQIEREPWVKQVRREGDCVQLRLDDGWIETIGAALEAGASTGAALADLAHGERYSVQFWDANATKALHIGHLRNLAIGNAVAAALTQAGGQVERRSLISDAGRSMGEAMAGVMNSGRHGHSWPDGDEKSDHFVGVCYADYVAANGSFSGAEIEYPEDSLTRELALRDDAADELLRRVMSGELEALQLWYKTRAWVISGQRKTLARLGVAFDRVFFESDFLADAARLTAAGLRDGRLRRREDGVVIYATGLKDFEEFPLVRADGVPTQHMRSLAYWMAAPELEDMTSMQVCGTEWVSHVTCRRKLMSELLPGWNGHAGVADGAGEVTGPDGGSGPNVRGPNGADAPSGQATMHPTLDIFNGMVSRQKRALASSEGALLIDDLIEALDRQIDASPAGRAVRRGHPFPERLASEIALGYFVSYPVAPPIDFEPTQLLDDGESLGWDIVRARAHHSGVATNGGRPKPGDARLRRASPFRPSEDPDYRFAVVQAELYRRYLRLAVQRYDVGPLALYLKHLVRWYMERPRGEHVERVVQTLLDRGARGLGMEAVR
jgi:arginyl-tRNA synthetase